MEVIAFAGLWCVAALVVLPVVAILAIMFVKGGRGISWELLTSVEEGILPAIVGTTALVVGVILISARCHW
jgi:ABC-type phosphate transport system permease subunit